MAMKRGLKRLCVFLIISSVFTALSSCDDMAADAGVTPVIPVAVDVKLKIGDILYENLDAQVTVNGYDESKEIKWTQVFEYTGGSKNVMEIPGLYHHYKFRVEKWGHSDEQEFSILQLNAERADGSSPGVLVLGGEVEAQKLSEVTQYFKSGATESPYNKSIYAYDMNGRLSRMDRKTYNGELGSFVLSDYTVFEYENNRVAITKTFEAETDALIESTTYEYNSSGNVVRMVCENLETENTGSADLTYNSNGSVTVLYENSNDTGFTYQMNLLYKNVISETITSGGSLCQDAEFTYDQHINPFKHLGYVDFLFTNYSINNRLTSAMEYNCSYPTLVPLSYDYAYDEKGYPTESITNFEGGSQGRETFDYK
jgi:hypothetical protein